MEDRFLVAPPAAHTTTCPHMNGGDAVLETLRPHKYHWPALRKEQPAKRIYFVSLRDEKT